MQVLEPLWVKTFSADTYACIKGRGIHALLRKMRRRLLENGENMTYCLKIDIRKFYPSINHDILKAVVRRKIKDPDVLWLLDDIIDSAEGVPIGNYISQYYANLYISDFDHDLKTLFGLKGNERVLEAYAGIYAERYRHAYGGTGETDAELAARFKASAAAFSEYFRYADDQAIFSGDKIFLSLLLDWIGLYYAREKKLEIKDNWQIFPVASRGVDFVGYVTYPTHCLVRKRNKQGLCRELAKLRKAGLPEDEIRLRVASRMGFMVHCNSIHLFNKLGMKKFSDIKPNQGKLTGTKYHIDQVLNREIHLTAFEVGKSKINDDDMLTLQYEILERLRDQNGTELVDDGGQPVFGWVKHITFTGSKALINQLEGVELTEPVAAKIIKQPIGDGKRCFYKLVDPDTNI